MESLKPICKVTKYSKVASAPNCKKHPKHVQSPGVCSICLGEKLSQLSNCNEKSSSSKGARTVYSSSSSSSSSSLSSLSSSDASSCSSPIMERYTCREGRNSMRVFNKSKSMAANFAPRSYESGKKINNGGFWSKLLPNRKLMHSTTMQIQRAITAVY